MVNFAERTLIDFKYDVRSIMASNDRSLFVSLCSNVSLYCLLISDPSLAFQQQLINLHHEHETSALDQCESINGHLLLTMK